MVSRRLDRAVRAAVKPKDRRNHDPGLRAHYTSSKVETLRFKARTLRTKVETFRAKAETFPFSDERNRPSKYCRITTQNTPSAFSLYSSEDVICQTEKRQFVGRSLNDVLKYLRLLALAKYPTWHRRFGTWGPHSFGP